jgi:hypothetical protein
MQVVGFDRKVAAAHGYEIRADGSGKEYSVKAGAPADAQPLNTLPGVCGTSMVQVTPIGNRQALIQTGFDVHTTDVARRPTG